MIFFHIGWMERYRGADQDDPTRGPHGYLKNRRFGHECFNFLIREGRCYGYAPIPGVRIERIGGGRGDLHVDDVTCVWVAKHPERGHHLIVGWYRQARIFRFPEQGDNQLDGQNIHYLATACSDNCTLLPTRRRKFQIPTWRERPGGLGRSVVWYGGDDGFREEVWNYVE